MLRDIPWQEIDTLTPLTTGEVHVWKANLDLPQFQLTGFLKTLAVDEQERAQRFYFQRDRTAFIAARGILRSILSLYTTISPQELHFSYSEQGKPYLTKSSIHFNLSHSHKLAVYAISLSPVGIDVEYIRPLEIEQLSQRFFSSRESAYIYHLPPPKQPLAFFRFWTAKEAYLKATGEGLKSLQQVEVSLWDDKVNFSQPLTNWSLKQFSPDLNYIATVTRPSIISHLSYFESSPNSC